MLTASTRAHLIVRSELTQVVCARRVSSTTSSSAYSHKPYIFLLHEIRLTKTWKVEESGRRRRYVGNFAKHTLHAEPRDGMPGRQRFNHHATTSSCNLQDRRSLVECVVIRTDSAKAQLATPDSPCHHQNARGKRVTAQSARLSPLSLIHI